MNRIANKILKETPQSFVPSLFVKETTQSVFLEEETQKKPTKIERHIQFVEENAYSLAIL